MKIALIGFGTVGQGLAEILRDKADELRARYDFAPQVVAVATRTRGTLYRPQGLSLDLLLDAIQKGSLEHYPDVDGLRRDWDVLQIIAESNADVVIDVCPSDFDTAQPALRYCLAAFENGRHLVLANKGPVALAYAELRAAAERAGKALRFEATVMAGMPSIRVGMEALAGCRIAEVRGILNGTTNYILTQMESGLPYGRALAKAQELGLAEADPSADVDGWDAAGKLLILAAVVFGRQLKMRDLEVKGIAGITTKNVELAEAEGKRWKLVARLTPEGGSVQPMPLLMRDPLAGVSGATNAITFTTDLLGDVTLIGAGAGRLQTGFGLLADLLDIHRQYG